MKASPFLISGLCCVLLLPAFPTLAWGPEGHRIVGRTAFSMLDDTALAAVMDILGDDPDTAVAKACFWPDTVRKTLEWEASAPEHYVNIPRSAWHYERMRDCPDGQCVTEAILKYADELSRPGLDEERRWRAFAWLCHLVGDLHQPLHTGYRDDRGANYVDVIFKGSPWNLHQFWDRALVRDRLGAGDAWSIPNAQGDWPSSRGTWNPSDVRAWTDESHALVKSSAYPANAEIDEEFADRSWEIIRLQWQKAALRLALILNATVGEGEITLSE